MKDTAVVITGASSGIGAALADLLAKKGARLALAARNTEKLAAVAARSGPNALAVTTDVTRRADVQRLADQTIARFGRIDVWVNNAGRGITRRVSELTDEDFDQMMLVNTKSALYGMQVVLPHFKAQKKGHIINVNSMLGRVPFAMIRSAYSASKHALNALTANLRMELAAEYPGITVSSVHPGVVATDFGLNALHDGPDSRALPFAQPVEEVAEVIADLIEHPRADAYTRPEGQKMVVAYFAAEDMAAAERQFPAPPPGARTSTRPA